MKNFPTAPPPPNRLMIFARVPEMGRVKTRLSKELGEQRTLAIYEAMLSDLLQSVGESDAGLFVEVLWTAGEAAGGELLRKYFGSLPLAMQTGSSLGERLAIAFAERIFFHRAEKVMAIGTDDPSLPRQRVERAMKLLECCDWVLGPAHDGGYYLIGCRSASFDMAVFEGIDWGSESVFAETADRIRGTGATLAILPPRPDIDRPEDLRAFARSAQNGSRLAELLRNWGWEP